MDVEGGRAELHFISGEIRTGRFMRAIVEAYPYVDYVHLRDPEASARQLAEAAAGLLEAGVPAGKLIINDRVDVAVAVGAAGVQLGWRSLEPGMVKQRWPQLRVGRSVHTAEEARQACEESADYVLFGHVFDSASKAGLPGRGLEELAETVRCAAVPVIAIGGIRPGHVADILRRGAAGFAVLSGIGEAEDPAAAAASYRAAADVAVNAGDAVIASETYPNHQ